MCLIVRVLCVSDYCSTLKLTDQSGAKVGCTIFCEKQEKHPKIFKIGDVIRLHRVKVEECLN